MEIFLDYFEKVTLNGKKLAHFAFKLFIDLDWFWSIAVLRRCSQVIDCSKIEVRPALHVFQCLTNSDAIMLQHKMKITN